jgi:hypothetical protein
MFRRLKNQATNLTRVTFVILSGLIGQPALAQDADGMALTADGRFPLNEELCGMVIQTMASLTMLKRQAGEPLSDVMSAAAESDAIFNFNNTARDMALAAYDAPRFNTRQNQMDAANDFANEWVLACYRAER